MHLKRSATAGTGVSIAKGGDSRRADDMATARVTVKAHLQLVDKPRSKKSEDVADAGGDFGDFGDFDLQGSAKVGRGSVTAVAASDWAHCD